MGGGNSGVKKRRKRKLQQNASNVQHSDDRAAEHTTFGLERGCHSYGVQPLGNFLLAVRRINVRNEGLGNVRALSDEIVCDILELLNAKDLARLGIVSKALYVFCHQDSLWRRLVLEEFKGGFLFKGSWKETYISCAGFADYKHVPIKVKDFYSDYLFQSWLCASVEIKQEWLQRDNIERRKNLSVEEFIRDFEEPNKPVLITNCIDDWPALKKWRSREYLLQQVGEEVSFAAGPVEMKLREYFTYADAAQEERPLYLFDSKFGEKAPALTGDYEVPIYFREDLFKILGTDERPDYRWLIIGPARSGSSFHIDPNSTSAWNAVVTGSKKWILYPPNIPPPGVHPSPDGAEVATPVSITEWFLNFYQQSTVNRRSVECICRAGEVVFIPNGWWHVVINLEDSIAITQNYVSRNNLLNVLDFISRPNSKQLVSGTVDGVNLYEKFKRKYEEMYPGSIEELRRKDAAGKESSSKKKSFWECIVESSDPNYKFSFN